MVGFKHNIHILKGYKLRKEVEKKYDFSVVELCKTINQAFLEQCPELDIKHSKFANFGGANNAGMIMHFDQSNKVKALTKIESKKLAERELQFQQWQTDHLDSSLAPQAYLHGNLANNGLGWVTSEVLIAAGPIGTAELISLYKKLNVNLNTLKLLSQSDNVTTLSNKILPDTNIKSVLHHLVSGTGTTKNRQYMHQFFFERSDVLEGIIEPKILIELIHKIYDTPQITMGLLHGDFKSHNLMRDQTGNLKVIDLQYYSYGRRVWDLAFYFSRTKYTAQNIYLILEQLEILPKADKLPFLVFYIVASIINYKPNKITNVRKNKLEFFASILQEQVKKI